MKHAIAFCAMLGCALAAAPARAESGRFEFREFFATGSVGALTITGSFTGEVENGRIVRLSEIHLFRDGAAFRGNGALYTLEFDHKTRSWREGGYLSFDGSANNIMFIDTNYGDGDSSFFNYFYSVTGIGNAAFQPSFYRYQVPQSEMTVTEQQQVQPPAIPEPSSWALLIAGFGALGSGMRAGRTGGTRARVLRGL